MSDYIKRDDAIRLLRGRAAAKYPVSFYVGLFAAADEIERMPAADVAPAVGKWVECMVTKHDCYGLVFGWKCSACGYSFEDRNKFRKKPTFMKFCHNCGARMEAES